MRLSQAGQTPRPGFERQNSAIRSSRLNLWPPALGRPGEHSQSEFLYYSFVVLTTLGFGDLSPSVGLPQALTALEALAGSIFLVTLVARLVTLWVRDSA